MLEILDAFRRPQRLTEFLLVCEADVRGRTGFEKEPYQQADLWNKAYQLAAAVDVKAIIASGKQGVEIKKELQKQRIAALR